MKLDAIPVVAVSAPGPHAALTGNAGVVLREIAEKVRLLVDAGEASTIDLLAMPLSAGRPCLAARAPGRRGGPDHP